MERLEQHGETLAAAQSVTQRPRIGRPIRRRVAENGRVLLGAYRALSEAIKDERSITPAAEWLVDNFHIVEEQVREIRDDLPAHYYRELPKLAEGPLEGYPRVLGLAWAYVAHTDSRFDPDSLRRLVAAYQRVQPLTLGELWAVAISLRILLVENLRRLAEQIVAGRVARARADELADGLLGIGVADSDGADLARRRLERLHLPTAGMVQLFQRLRDQDPAVTPALQRLEELLASEATTAEETVRLEHQRQASMNVTVRNVITSMRLISWFDWAQFVESVSLIDESLRVNRDFAAMDFATRDRYRHAIEEIARSAGVTEIDVARAAIDMAARPATENPGTTGADIGDVANGPSTADPGRFLIGDARPALERALRVRLPLAVRFRRAYLRSATIAYLGSIAGLTAIVLAVPLILSLSGGDGLALLLVVLVGLGPASDLAVSLINRGVAALLGPRTLPRLELAEGVPADLRTLVVVPTLLGSLADVEARVAGLEIHYLANPDGDVRFALLSDWLDAATETAPDDNSLLAAAVSGIEGLNDRYGEAPGGGARFLLFHRKRRWNPGEGRWMGWERKRGKLHELNALLRGSTGTDILVTGAREAVPPAGIRYVITLDSDTKLPRGAIDRLVGTIAHPLNRASFDPESGRITRGYGILQPRITSTLPAEHEATIFQRAYSGAAGIDPYASAVSDVYQDLFGEGSYTGKGIYDLDAFEAAMADRAPENTLLSHDLFEGLFARAGLVTDVELFDEFPSHYLEAAARQHRWARGDWQLLPWILGRARDARGRRRPAIPAIGRWKMIDNLRRTGSAPLALATLGVAWLVPVLPAAWTGLVLGSILIPELIPVVAGLLPRRQGISRRSHLRAVGGDISLAAVHVGLGVVFLADQAWLMADAIVRALTRLGITRRQLLEWTTAAQAKANADRRIAGFYRRMAGGVGLAIGIGSAVVVVRPESAWLAIPFAALWAVAPVVASVVSRPPAASGPTALVPADMEALRLIARRTWRFFEAFVGPEDHGLPPDNFQDVPKPVIAHRTSPTNIGLYLLATVTARDLGWIGTSDMVERLEATLDTIDQLQRFRGHLYNWYDTRTLEPLGDRYVSSVDSGNLAGHLLTVSGACRDVLEHPIPTGAAAAGVGDALALVEQAARRDADEGRSQTLTRRNLDEALADLPALVDGVTSTCAWTQWLAEMAARTRTLADIAAVLTSEWGGDPNNELVVWAEAAASTVESHRKDIAGSPMPIVGADPALAPETGGDARPAMPAPLERRLGAVAAHARRLFEEMDFTFLFDPTRKLFSIGFSVTDGAIDPSYYDLLASECRLASFLAIAKGDVDADHWFRLGRALTPVGRGSALISWSGSMFEYLMPALVMRAHPLSLMDQTYRLVVARQIGYGAANGVPWGISESAYNARDLDQIYQYASFGIPGLGLKRGLSENLVIAPYATGLAAMVDAEAAVRNFERLTRAGAAGAVRVPGGPRLHAAAVARGRAGGTGDELHGASPGHAAGRHRQRPHRVGHGRSIPRRSAGSGNRAPAPGADAA